MKNINTRKLYYHFRHHYLTMNNVVIAVAFVIAASWVWGSIDMMQRNYTLQKEVDSKQRQKELAELEVQSMAYQKQYHQSSEYQELAARDNLNLADPGEKVLILPPNSKAASESGEVASRASRNIVPPSNFQQWANFLFGGNRQS